MKRLRIFAGPNGSGKSTIIKVVTDAGVHLGLYINADEYKKELNKTHCFNFSNLNIIPSEQDFQDTYHNSLLFDSSDGKNISRLIMFNKEGFALPSEYMVNDYFTSFLADYVRNKLLGNCNKFTSETVMSHPSKLDFICKAQEMKYKVYLYFVSLSDPTLNLNRVQQRVQQGGHDVPPEKIKERYYRTMELLLDAIKLVDKAYIFDNSYSEPKLFASIENDEIKISDNIDYIPTWFQEYVLNKL